MGRRPVLPIMYDLGRLRTTWKYHTLESFQITGLQHGLTHLPLFKEGDKNLPVLWKKMK